MKHVKKSYIIIISLLVLTVTFFGASYAYFTSKNEEHGKLNIVAGTLDYKIESKDLENNRITVESGTIKILDISLISLNSISSKYEIYYKLNIENIEDVIVGYGDNYDKSFGIIDANGKKKLKIFINNKSENDVIVEFGVEGGFVNNELELSKYNSLVCDDSIPTITIGSNLPNSITKGDSYELIDNYSVSDLSGGNISCISNVDGVITDTSELTTLGTHNITCTASTGVGTVATVEKNIVLTYSSYNITNLFTNGSFEDGFTGWNSNLWGKGGVTLSTKYQSHGNNSIYVNAIGDGMEKGAAYLTPITLTKDHKYYLAVDTFLESYTSSTGNEIIYLFNKEKSAVALGFDYNKLHEWQELSGLFTSTITSSYSDIRIGQVFTSVSVYEAYVDSLILIDLTDAFGEGNEPDKEWCDKHISYFDDTNIIYK